MSLMTNKVIDCAIAMLDVLTVLPGERVLSDDLRQGIRAHGANPYYIHLAAKWLRNRGIPVASRKRRHLSTWWVQGSTHDLGDYLDRITQEAYSEQVSITRGVSRLSGPGSTVLRRKSLATAVVLGERLGLDASQVVEQCRPLPMPNGTP